MSAQTRGRCIWACCCCLPKFSTRYCCVGRPAGIRPGFSSFRMLVFSVKCCRVEKRHIYRFYWLISLNRDGMSRVMAPPNSGTRARASSDICEGIRWIGGRNVKEGKGRQKGELQLMKASCNATAVSACMLSAYTLPLRSIEASAQSLSSSSCCCCSCCCNLPLVQVQSK